MTKWREEGDVGLAALLFDVLPSLARRVYTTLPTETDSPELADELHKLAELRATSGQVTLLGILVKHERATMQELATRLAVTPAAVTMMVKRLLAQGYVERLRDEQDWRLVWITPTEQGRRAIHLYREMRLMVLEERLALLSEEEQRNVRDALPALQHLFDLYTQRGSVSRTHPESTRDNFLEKQ